MATIITQPVPWYKVYFSTMDAAPADFQNGAAVEEGSPPYSADFIDDLNKIRGNIMNKIAQGVKQFLNDEEGVTAIEYGLIAALIAVVILTTVQSIGTSLDTKFKAILAAL
ncbi:Flp pilus assembly protein, pilin Flp [Nitrosospira multiformis]|uniref:Flp pilus assembly protein, pilin Flp n=1 Tax=Nitrosospira multiformis TaxID=1231 RepID=A0A1H8K680_9PROT|nr:Flp family type IVb pilin [Nitrosospira multiformis]SEN88463.1 Flp pilus assembly protein, pilin Flp [Nitrosospira multiformis]